MGFLNRRAGFFVIALVTLALVAAILASGLYLGGNQTAAADTGAQSAAGTVAPAATNAPAAQPTAASMQGMGDTRTGMDMSQQGAQTGPAQGIKNASQQAGMVPDVSFTLRTDVGQQGLSFVGVGGNIDGQHNPKLIVAEGAVVQITLINGDGALHDVVFPDFGGATEQVAAKGSSSTTVFKADKAGEFAYFCSLPGHRQAGMEGVLAVGEAQVVEETGADIVMDPSNAARAGGKPGGAECAH